MKKVFVSLLVLIFIIQSIYSQNPRNEMEYRRSSIYPMMISYEGREFREEIKAAFKSYPISEKFNEHIVGPSVISLSSTLNSKDKALDNVRINAIKQYLDSLEIAKRMVAKWFNRYEMGGFDMNLVAERGLYDASELDVREARESERGIALLADAGEELIENTFVIVNDFQYINKEEVVDKAGGVLEDVSGVASKLGLFKSKDDVETSMEVGEVFGKGYVIKSQAYLFRLIWDENTAYRFYSEFWTESPDLDLERVQKFEETKLFDLEFVGSQAAWVDIQSTKFTEKSNEELIAIATIKAADAAIAKLQGAYEVFRLKAPLISVDPIAAKVGLKEGIGPGDAFEVLEPVKNAEGIIEYRQIGIIKVEKDQIWDNTYMAHEAEDTYLEYTSFKKPILGFKGDLKVGLLIRQLK